MVNRRRKGFSPSNVAIHELDVIDSKRLRQRVRVSALRAVGDKTIDLRRRQPGVFTCPQDGIERKIECGTSALSCFVERSVSDPNDRGLASQCPHWSLVWILRW